MLSCCERLLELLFLGSGGNSDFRLSPSALDDDDEHVPIWTDYMLLWARFQDLTLEHNFLLFSLVVNNR